MLSSQVNQKTLDRGEKHIFLETKKTGNKHTFFFRKQISTSIMYVSVCDVFKTVSFSMLCTFSMHTIFRKKPVSKYSSDSEAENLKSVPICPTDSIYNAIATSQ